MAVDLGDVAALAVQIRDAEGQPADAGTVTLTVTQPDGTAVGVATIRTGVGEHAASFTPVMPGLHAVRWSATPPNAAAFHDAFTVADSLPPLLGLDDIKSHLNKDVTVRVSDEELRITLAAATALAEAYTGRALRPFTWTGGITATGAGVLILPRAAATRVVAVTDPSGRDLTTSIEMDDDQEGTYLRHASRPLFGRHSVTVRLGVTGQALDIAQQGVRELVRHMWEPQRGGAPRPLQAPAETRPVTAHALPWSVTDKLDQIQISA